MHRRRQVKIVRYEHPVRLYKILFDPSLLCLDERRICHFTRIGRERKMGVVGPKNTEDGKPFWVIGEFGWAPNIFLGGRVDIKNLKELAVR